MIDYDKLNPPALELRVFNGEPYEKMNTDPKWLRVGYIPEPRTRFGWFLYHMAHGIAMRYPFWEVVKFSFANLSNESNESGISAEQEHGIQHLVFDGCSPTITDSTTWSFDPKSICPNCGDNRTLKGSLIDTTRGGQAFCNEACYVTWVARTAVSNNS